VVVYACIITLIDYLFHLFTYSLVELDDQMRDRVSTASYNMFLEASKLPRIMN
jgi:hypothetical protein